VTSDNGAAYDGDPGALRGRKSSVYEGGHRVPFIARWPGRIPAGRGSDAMAMNIDILPTVLGLAGLPLPDDRVIDGRDVMAVLEGDAPSPHDYLFYNGASGFGIPAVRDARFKYLRTSGWLLRSKPHLSSLADDRENHNLLRRHPQDSARLRAVLDAMQEEFDERPRGWRTPHDAPGRFGDAVP